MENEPFWRYEFSIDKYVSLPCEGNLDDPPDHPSH